MSAIRALMLLAVFVVVAALVFAGVRCPSVFEPKSEKAAVAAACADLRRLVAARLTGDASSVIPPIRKAAGDNACAATKHASLQSLRELARRLAADHARRAEALARAVVYRRASRLRRSKTLAQGQRNALKFAANAYVVALRIDPYNPNARRGLRAILGARGGPGRTAGANARCTVANGLLGAGLMPEARLVFAQALRTARTTRCLRNGLKDSRERSGVAFSRLRLAQRLQRAGRRRGARREYLRALIADSSLGSARTALAKLRAPAVKPPTGWEETRACGRRAVRLSGRAIGDVGDAVKPLLLVAIALFFMLTFWSRGFRRLGYHSSGFRQWADGHKAFKRYARTELVVERGAEREQEAGVAEMIVEAFNAAPVPAGLAAASAVVGRSQPDAADAAGEPSTLGAVTGALGVDAFAKVLSALPSAIVGRVAKVVPTLLLGGDVGRGLRLEITDGRGRGREDKLFRPEPGDAALTANELVSLLCARAGGWLRGQDL